MNWLNALGSVPQDRVFVVRNGVWGNKVMHLRSGFGGKKRWKDGNGDSSI